MKQLCMISMILMVVGAVNWGLVGLMGLDLVAAIFGGMPMLAKLVYILVGLAGVHGLYMLITKKNCCPTA